MGKGQKIASPDEKAVALQRRLGAAIRWYWFQKCVDAVILLSIVACVFVGYAGHVLEACLLLTVVTIVASWRFFSNRFESTGCSGEWGVDDDVPPDVSHSHDTSDSSWGGDSSSDAGSD